MRKVLILFFSLLSSSLSASTYYIDTSGNDNTGTGSASNPWKSLYKACNSVKTPGDIIHVNADLTLKQDQAFWQLMSALKEKGLIHL
jgi:hypothetical protein